MVDAIYGAPHKRIKKTLLIVDDSQAKLLLSQWDYTLNNMSLENVSVHSKSKFWWRCELGHSWEAAMANRYVAKAGCHVCTNRVILVGYNDLRTVSPTIADEWHPTLNTITPEEVTVSSGKTVHWLCKDDNTHIWSTKISNRTKTNRPTGCPYCKNQKVITGVNDLATLFPKLSEEWDNCKNSYKAEESFAKTSKMAWWIGRECGHSWDMRISDRTLSGNGCPFCSGNRVLTGFNDLLTVLPNLINSSWDYDKNEFSPDTVTKGSGLVVWWNCDKGHSWDTSVENRVRGHNCLICAGKRVLVGDNDLMTTNPDLVAEWDYDKNTIKPTEVTSGSSQRVWWNCDKAHSWQTTVNDRHIYKTNCPTCFNSGISAMEKDFGRFLELILPDIVIESNVRGVISPKELDFYVPELGIAFEFNGLYWHSSDRKAKDYHYNKWLACKDKSIQLITIWEDDWRDKRDVVEKMVSHKVGASDGVRMYARKTYIDSDVKYADASVLLNGNHIQGAAAGSTYVGLRSKEDDSLVAVAVLREKDLQTAELVRYATGVQVVGGFTKILKWVELNLGYSQVETFSDNEISDGSLYSSHGFLKVSELSPDYKYLDGGRRRHKFLYRKDRFESVGGLLFEAGLSELELAGLNGLLRVYDSGKVKWVKVF